MAAKTCGEAPPPSSKIVTDEEVEGANVYAIAIAAIAAKFKKVKQTKVARRPRRAVPGWAQLRDGGGLR